MKNIILQHYTGIPGELERRSMMNIELYANSIGAEYKFLQGDQFCAGMTSPCQKMVMLDEKWDDYDYVVMMDIDMFAVNGLSKNVFTDINGVGLFYETTRNVFANCRSRHPTLCDPRYAYWGGCLWRLSRNLRQTFRKHINMDEMWKFSGNFEDEGMMHRLAVLTKTPPDPIPQSWSYCSYLPHPEKADIIHIRTKITPTGPKRTKLENYNGLKDRGIIK